jgi:hypothetical protein
MKWNIAGVCLIGMVIGSAHAQPPPPGYAPPPPGYGAAPPPPSYAPIPPPRQEFVPPPPGGRVVWQPGHWFWNGHRYIWVEGRYVARHRRPMHWVAGEWVWRGRWVWIPAHWG